MLAPRIIHYTRRQMIWECAEGLASEGYGPEPSGPHPLANPLGKDYPNLRKRWLQPLFTEALVGASSRFRVPLNAAENGIPLLLQAWQECVSVYSNRRLTMPSDKLHAVAGIATLLNISGGLGYHLAGIWTEHLVDHLVWRRQWRRLERPLSLQKDYRAPTWSWASLDGRVTYLTELRELGFLRLLNDGTENERPTMFDLKLEKHRIILKHKRNIYGAVLNGSYIIVESACITCEALDQLLIGMSLNPSRHLISVTDDSEGKSAIDRLLSRHRVYKEPERHVYYDEHEEEDFTLPHQFCMYLVTSNGSIEAVLLSWVDREAGVARRVGLVQLDEYSGEYFDHFKDGLHTADWQRWTLRLV